MQLSVITPAFNGQQFIKNYLDSLTRNLPPDCEVIIVDNGSIDQTKAVVKKYKGVKLVENSTNTGFGHANNQGAKIATGEYLAFINQDIVVYKHSIDLMLDYAKAHPEIGLLAPKLINPDGQIQKSVTHLPTLWRAIEEFFLGKKNSYSQYAPDVKQPIEVEAVYGAVILISKKLFEEMGGWNEKYFVYYEDLELCRQLKKRGLKIMYLPYIEFKHLLGASSKPQQSMLFGIRTLSWFWPIKSSGSRYYMLQSARRYHGVLVATLIRLVIYLGMKFR